MSERKHPNADMPFKEKMAVALSGILNHAPFEGSLIAACQMLPGEAPQIPTMATDCVRRVWVNEAYCANLSPDHVRTMLAHEALHVAYMHAFQTHQYPKIANIAFDYIINRDLNEAGHDFSAWVGKPLAELIKELEGKPAKMTGAWIPLDPTIDPALSSEDIYDLLVAAAKRNPKFKKDKSGDGSGTSAPDLDGVAPEGDAMMNDIDKSAVGEAAAGDGAEQLQADQMLRVSEALNIAKAIGRTPSHVTRLIGALEAPKVKWEQVLRKFVRDAMGPGSIDGEYAYRRPSRRVGTGGIILPRITKKPAPDVVVVIDTSGSIAGPELDRFFAELNGIVKDFKPATTHVLSCDAEVHTHDRCAPGDDIRSKVTPKGGGGTDLPKAFRFIEDKHIKPACFVVLTDGYTGWNDPPRGNIPVIWAMTTDVVAPYGKTVRI